MHIALHLPPPLICALWAFPQVTSSSRGDFFRPRDLWDQLRTVRHLFGF